MAPGVPHSSNHSEGAALGNGAGTGAKTCGDAKRGLQFYRQREAYWRAKMGAAIKPKPARSVGGCPHVRLLAKLARGNSADARSAYEQWWESIGVTVNRLNRGLQGTPMAGTGAILERHGRRHHVSPFFMAAAAGTESSFGEAACGYGGYNAWGLANCDGSWGVPTFHSWDDAIGFYARFLHSRWPNARTPYDFVGYAACSSCWGAKTAWWMRSRFGVGPTVRYP